MANLATGEKIPSMHYGEHSHVSLRPVKMNQVAGVKAGVNLFGTVEGELGPTD